MSTNKIYKYGRRVLYLFLFVFILHFCSLILFYFFQEAVLFRQQDLDQSYQFKFRQPFEEVFIPSTDDVPLHGIYFPSTASNRVVLFFHGNGGTVKQWGHDASFYLEHGYSVLFMDYRGYGKSGGEIATESELIDDAQRAYEHLLNEYTEDQITIVGLSMGTGIASQLAANNHPHKLILMAPYYWLEDLIQQKAFVVPKNVIRYKLKTFDYIADSSSPIHILHGKSDKLIPFKDSERLQQVNPEIKLYELPNCGHMIARCGQSFRSALGTALSEN